MKKAVLVLIAIAATSDVAHAQPLPTIPPAGSEVAVHHFASLPAGKTELAFEKMKPGCPVDTDFHITRLEVSPNTYAASLTLGKWDASATTLQTTLTGATFGSGVSVISENFAPAVLVIPGGLRFQGIVRVKLSAAAAGLVTFIVIVTGVCKSPIAASPTVTVL